MQRGNFEEKGADHCKVLGLSAVSCSKTAEAIQMPFWTWTWVGPRKQVLDGVHTIATWQIRLNSPYAAAMQSYEKLEMWANAQRDGRPAEYR